MLIDLQVLMNSEEGITIDLPGIEANPEPQDPEARIALGLPLIGQEEVEVTEENEGDE
jgi:hypothetical protein